MSEKTSAHYQRLYRQRLREQGLVKKEVWILPRHSQVLASLERQLRHPEGMAFNSPEEESSMTTPQTTWTAQTLFTALASTTLMQSGRASAEIVQGNEASLHIRMSEYGDLPLFLAVSGGQIVVEALLWPASDVRDTDAFNEQILRARNLFPLSSIGVGELPNGKAYYLMFGALSAASSLSNVVEEIETLADNVIRATEAFEGFLKSARAASA